MSPELEKEVERIALRLLEKDMPEMCYEDATPEMIERYRERARRFVETVRRLHSPDPQTKA